MTKHARLCASVYINDGASLSSASASACRDLSSVCVCVLTGCVSEPPSLPMLFKPHKHRKFCLLALKLPLYSLLLSAAEHFTLFDCNCNILGAHLGLKYGLEIDESNLTLTYNFTDRSVDKRQS